MVGTVVLRDLLVVIGDFGTGVNRFIDGLKVDESDYLM